MTSVLFNEHLNIRKKIFGRNNFFTIGHNLNGGNLNIIIRGNNNKVKIGNNCVFYNVNTIWISGDGNDICFGDSVTLDGNNTFVLAEGTTCRIGDDCMFAQNVLFRTSDQHPIYDIDNKRINQASDIVVGSHVWLGANVTVMKGVKIGNGCMVGYGALVTKDIASNSIAAGIPAKVIQQNITWGRQL